jgi:SH3-like domain-containing protein
MLILSIFLRKMIHLKKTWLPLIACFCLSCLSPAASSQTIWQGKSGGFNIHWTQKDITATKGGKVVFSAEKALARKDFEKAYLDYTNGYRIVGYHRTLTLLSVVGTIVSMKDTFEEGGRVLIYGDSKMTTVNLANLDKVVSLTDFFGESVIFKALLADSLIQKALAKVNTTTPPSTLDALYQVLDKAPNIAAVRMKYGEDCYFRLSEDFLTQFAFHHIDKDRVAVRIALSPATHGCQSELAQLGIYLPIPNKLKSALKKAQKGQAGKLMNNLQKIAKEQQTTISFSADTYMPYPVAGTRVITVSNARLRRLPQATNSDIVATLKKETVLKTLARTSFQEDSHRYHRDYWYLVELENGKIGWIFGALTKMLEKAPPTSPRRTTDNGVRVRSAPNLKASIVKTLDKGVIVHAFTRSKRQDNIDNILDYWYQVHLDRDKTGWIFGGLLMETETRVRVSMGEKIHARSAPDQQSDVVETFDYQYLHLYVYGRSKHQDKIDGILDYWYQVGESRNRYQGGQGGNSKHRVYSRSPTYRKNQKDKG